MATQSKENQEPPFSGSSDEFPAAQSPRPICHSCDLNSPAEVETSTEDQESIGSSEETESPKSVAKAGDWRKKMAYVHYQIRRIREEDLHLGEDIGEGFNAKEKISNPIGVGTWCDVGQQCKNSHQMNLVIFSRPILSSSPLSGKNTHLGH